MICAHCSGVSHPILAREMRYSGLRTAEKVRALIPSSRARCDEVPEVPIRQVSILSSHPRARDAITDGGTNRRVARSHPILAREMRSYQGCTLSLVDLSSHPRARDAITRPHGQRARACSHPHPRARDAIRVVGQRCRPDRLSSHPRARDAMDEEESEGDEDKLSSHPRARDAISTTIQSLRTSVPLIPSSRARCDATDSPILTGFALSSHPRARDAMPIEWDFLPAIPAFLVARGMSSCFSEAGWGRNSARTSFRTRAALSTGVGFPVSQGTQVQCCIDVTILREPALALEDAVCKREVAFLLSTPAAHLR